MIQHEEAQRQGMDVEGIVIGRNMNGLRYGRKRQQDNSEYPSLNRRERGNIVSAKHYKTNKHKTIIGRELEAKTRKHKETKTKQDAMKYRREGLRGKESRQIDEKRIKRQYSEIKLKMKVDKEVKEREKETNWAYQ